MGHRALALLLLAVGCSGSKDTTAPTPDMFDVGDDDDDNGADTADSGEGGTDAKLVAEVRFRAFVAVDSSLGMVVSPIFDGDPDYISAYIIDLYEKGWTDSDEESYCQVSIEIPEGTALADVYGTGFNWGVDIPAGAYGKSMGSDCLSKGFDAGQFTNGDPTADWAEFDWHMRFGGTLTADLIDWLTPDTTTGFDIAEYAAGDWWTDTAYFETDADNNFWYAYAMDAGHNVDLDTRLTTDFMVDATGAPMTAYFIFDQRVYWDLTATTTE